MSNCIAIRLKNRANYQYCQSYTVTANEDGTGAGVESLLCDGITTQQQFIPPGQERIICVQFGEVPQKVSGTSTITAELIGVCTDESSLQESEAIYFDLPVNFSLRETKRLTELTDLNAIKFTYSLGFELPPTKHNLDLIKTRVNPNVLDNDYSELEVEVIAGSHIQSEAQLYVKRCNKNISADLRLSVNHWARKAKSLLLRDLPYADVTFGCDLINDVIQNQWPYQSSTNFTDPNNLGIWFPYVDYGRLVRDISQPGRRNDWVLPVCYNRPWYYLTGILQRGFCALGWGFKSPVFESEIGRKLITYIMDKNYGLSGQVYEQRRNNLTTKAESQGDTAMIFQYGNKIGSIWWPQITEDPVGNMDTQRGWYSACGEVNIRGKVILQDTGSSTKIDLHIARVKPQDEYGVGGGGSFKFSPLVSREFTALDNEIEWEFEKLNVSVSSEEQVAILIERDGSGLVLLKDTSFIEYEGVRPYPAEGQAESLQNMIDGQYTFLDIIKGAAHACNIKFKTDFANRTVEMYQPYTGNFWGETIEGFFIEETIEDIEALIDPTSKDVTTPNTEQARYVEVSYADTSDTYIESLELAKPLFSTEFDLGEKYTTKETTPLANPFFEPTATRNAKFSNSFALHIPKIGGETEYTFDVGPRLIIARGFVTQEIGNASQPNLRLCTCDAPQSTLIPTGSMFSPVKLGTVHNSEGALVDYPPENLAFGINPEVSTLAPEVTLFDLAYRRWLIEQLNNIVINYLVDLSQYDYRRTDFRTLVQFNHMGRPVRARIQQIKDYRYCKKLFTPVDFIPERQLSNICGLLPITSDGDAGVCENNPVLICTEVASGHYIFSIGGQNTSPITATTFEYSTDGGTVWLPITPLTLISAELTGISVSFLVRASVVYGEYKGVICDSIDLPQKPVDPCPPFRFLPVCEAVKIFIPGSESTDGRRIVFGLPPGQDVTVITAEYSIENGPLNTLPYSIANEQFISGSVGGGDDVQFYVTLQVGICPPVDIGQECIIVEDAEQRPPVDCSDIAMELQCVEGFPGCFTFQRSGILFGENDNYIKYQCSEDGINYGPWLLWDEQTPVCCNFIRARWWAVFCGDECPTKCSPIVECGLGCGFVVGTVNNIALCS